MDRGCLKIFTSRESIKDIEALRHQIEHHVKQAKPFFLTGEVI